MTTLMAFDFVIQYKQGKDNVLANVLSRQFSENPLPTTKKDQGTFMPLSMVEQRWLQTIRNVLVECKYFFKKQQQYEKGELSSEWSISDGILFYKGRISLAPSSVMIPILIREIHPLSYEG